MAEGSCKVGPLDKSTIIRRLKEKDVTERINKPDILAYSSMPSLQAASVLVPLILCKNGELKMLLTVRAKNLRTHGGDVAFPGGKQDEEDEDVTAAALREAWEEIGLHQTDVEVVSKLPPMISKYGIYITPITALIPEDFVPNLNPNEVEDVFDVPLSDFLVHDHHSSLVTPNLGRFARVHFFEHFKGGEKYVNYGITSYLCVLAACVVYDRVPDFEMEPGFDLNNIMNGLFNHIERETGKQFVLSSSKI